MKLNYYLSLTLCLLLASCGSESTNQDKYNSKTQQDSYDNTNSTHSTDEFNKNNQSAYEQNGDILIETRSDGSKLAWINTQKDNLCKISRPEGRDGTVHDEAKRHCLNLNVGGISTWRLPTESEARYLMKNASNHLLFPASNPNCAYMTVVGDAKFVYTTSPWNRDRSKVGASFQSSKRDHATAGIRCVADQ